MKNLVLATSTNFTQSSLERFIGSFRQSDIDDVIAICINQLDVTNNKDFLRYTHDKYKVDYLIIDDSHLTNKYYIQNDRFRFYQNIINEYNVDKVFICDCRDVIFQDNIFKNDGLIFVKEADIIQNEPFNTFVIRSYNNQAYETIKNKPILNVGTILGKKEDIINVCKLITEYLKTAPVYFNEVGNPFLYDQAVFNIIVHYTDLIKTPYTLTGNNEDVVNTIGLAHSYRNINDEGVFVNISGNIPAVVHQFDRCSADLINKIANRNLPITDLL